MILKEKWSGLEETPLSHTLVIWIHKDNVNAKHS